MAGEIYVDANVSGAGAAVIKVGGMCYQLVSGSDQLPSVTEIDQSYGSCEECEGGPSSSSNPSSSSSSALCACDDYSDLPTNVYIDEWPNTACECNTEGSIEISLAFVGNCTYELSSLTGCEGYLVDVSIELVAAGNGDAPPCYWELGFQYAIFGQDTCDAVYRNYGLGPDGVYTLHSSSDNTPPATVTVGLS